MLENEAKASRRKFYMDLIVLWDKSGYTEIGHLKKRTTAAVFRDRAEKRKTYYDVSGNQAE